MNDITNIMNDINSILYDIVNNIMNNKKDYNIVNDRILPLLLLV